MLVGMGVLLLVAPPLLVVPLDGRPVRFGAPMPAAVIAGGLRLEGKGTLQWRRLPIGPPDADPVWIEIAIVGPPGTVRIVAGGAGPCQDGRGSVFVREHVAERLPHGERAIDRWTWSDGTVDACEREFFLQPTVVGAECYAAGEARTVWSEGAASRHDVLCRLPRRWFDIAGLLPPVAGGGATTKDLRAHLARVLPRLHELPGARGAGDYARSGGVVTNLEFDTTLALLRCAAGLGDTQALARALRAATHLRDRDLDLRTGLPFPHGPEHRCGLPEPGHAWLQGLLWVGLMTANDSHLVAAQNLARALAAHPPRGTGAAERLRDYAWPLAELEAVLAVAPDPVLARAADRLALSIARRFDPVARTFRFGEGEVGDGVYFERGWLTGGLLVPALRAHLVRRPDARLAAQVVVVQDALLERIGIGGPGMPTHWRIAGGETFAEHREQGTATAAFLLEAFTRADLQRLLRRATVRAAVCEVPSPDDPDLASQFSLLARCEWPWR